MGCRVLLALLVLHRAKLLTSNQSILALGRSPPYRSSAICATASCSGFVWLTTSILAWTRGGSPSNIAPSHGEGVWGFGKDAEIERPKALQDAKPTKRSYRDREFALFYKKQTFSTNSRLQITVRLSLTALAYPHYLNVCGCQNRQFSKMT
jgi:hypothetical protein